MLYAPMALQNKGIVKLDTSGNIVWNYIYDNGGSYIPAVNLCEAGSNNLFTVGSTGGAIVSSVINSSNGSPVAFGVQNLTLLSATIGSMACAPNGNNMVFAACLYSRDSLLFGEVSSSATLVNVTALDFNAIVGTSVNSSSFIKSLIRTSNGEYLALVDINAYSPNVFAQAIVRFNSSGTISMVKYYNDGLGLSSISGNDIYEATNGDMLVSGTMNLNGQTGCYIMRLSATGNLIWAKFIQNSGTSTYSTEHSNGDITIGIGSHALTPDNVNKSSFIRLDSTGNFLWCRNFGSHIGNSMYNISTNANGFAEAITFSYGYSGPGCIGTVNVDANGGMTGCYDIVSAVPVSAFSPVINTMPVTTVNCPVSMPVPTTFNTLAGINFTPYAPSLNVSGTVSDPLCFGGFGNVVINVSNGFTPYTFTWSNGTSNQNLLNVLGGTYTSRVADSKGCVRIDTFTVTSPTQLTATSSVTNVTCFGSQNGAINITPVGGTPGYTFQWATLDTTEDLSGLSGGFYQVIITDANNCQKTVGIAVQEPTQLISGISNSQNVSCYGMCNGSLTGIVSGGTQPYTYSWNNPGGSTTTSISGLCPGNYLFTVTDAKNCVSFSNGIITEPNPLNIATSSNESQCGINDGSAFAAANGGVAPYSYLWSEGTANDTALNLGNATYTVTVTDANNCNTSATATVGTETLPQGICLVTVDSMNHNVIVWEKAIATNIAGYNIYRNVVGAYSLIGYVPYDSLSEFVDMTFGVDPNITSYRYEISAVDTCGNESPLSSYHQTIHLTSNLGVGGDVNLIWDNYQGFAYSYNRILRDSTFNGNWQVLDSVASTNFTWTDLNAPTDSARYVIEVISPTSCTSTRAIINTSRSNVRNQAAPMSIGIGETEIVSAQVFPNPASDVLNIVFPFTGKKTRVDVFDAQGKLVHQSQMNSHTHQLNVRDMSEGIYFYVISEDDLLKAKGKFIVE